VITASNGTARLLIPVPSLLIASAAQVAEVAVL
jgi:hypothetical protein